MSTTDEITGARVGKGNPPLANKFQKGRSGNPRGRPRGRKIQPPYQTLLGQLVTVREDGVTRRMTAAEAFLLHIVRKGLAGDSAAARAAMAAIEDARARQGQTDDDPITVIIWKTMSVGSVNNALEALGAASLNDQFRETARLKLQPWLVEMALGRFGENTLSLAEQKTVWESARTPWNVQWPEWWCYRG